MPSHICFGHYILPRDHSSITSAKSWVGGVIKWEFLLIYSTIYANIGGWVSLKKPKHADVILEWFPRHIKADDPLYSVLYRHSLIYAVNVGIQIKTAEAKTA